VKRGSSCSASGCRSASPKRTAPPGRRDEVGPNPTLSVSAAGGSPCASPVSSGGASSGPATAPYVPTSLPAHILRAASVHCSSMAITALRSSVVTSKTPRCRRSCAGVEVLGLGAEEVLLVVHGADPVVNGEDADRTPVAALGGMVVPAVCFVLINSRAGGGALRGWAVPTATDIAFALAVLAGRSSPSSTPPGWRSFARLGAAAARSLRSAGRAGRTQRRRQASLQWSGWRREPEYGRQCRGGCQPSIWVGFQFSPTVCEPVTHEPSSGWANFACLCLSQMP